MNNRLALVILDGVGYTPKEAGNAVFLANMKNYERIKKEGLTTLIKTGGSEVGLASEKDAGNSEIGHNAIGSGQLIKQGVSLIEEQLANGEIFKTETWKHLCNNAKDKKLHFIGMLSNGRVHSDINQLLQLLTKAKEVGVKKMFIHAILDGRDTPPQGAAVFINQLNAYIKENNIPASLATVGGREEIVMDRYNTRISILQTTFEVYFKGEARFTNDVISDLEEEYKKNPLFIDENFKPVILDKEGKIDNGDSILLFNYRGDRAVEFSDMMENFKYVEGIKPYIDKCFYVGYTQYDADANLPRNFLVKPPVIKNTLTEWLSKNKINQYTIAETQKFGHVTYFFNGNRREKYDEKYENNLEISSRKELFHIAPQMRAAEVGEQFIKELGNKKYSFLKVNFANGDMVGHSGVLEATIKGLKIVDKELGKIYDECKKQGIILIVTADHGNAEEKLDEKGGRSTKHTANPVFFTFLDFKNRFKLNEGNFGLTNIASTICAGLGILPNPLFRSGIVDFKEKK